MKFLFSLLLFLSFTLTSGLQAQAENPPVLAVKAAITAFFNYDNEAYANSFTSTGFLVNPLGEVMVSPETIFTAHVPLFTIYWKDTNSKVKFLSADHRPLQDDLSLVRVKVNYRQFKNGVEIDQTTAQVSALVINTPASGWKLEFLQVTPVMSTEAGGAH